MKLMKYTTAFRMIMFSFVIITSSLFFTPIVNIDIKEDVGSVESLAMLSKEVNREDVEFDKYSYVKEALSICSSSSVKTYMSYKAITIVSSAQYQYIKNNMYVDETTGLLRNKEHPEFIGVALGTYYGKVGSMYEFTLDTGIVLKVVKIDVKSDMHTYNGCYHREDGSVIELVIDPQIAKKHYGTGSNGYILNGNFNNSSEFHGKIVSVQKINVVNNKN